MNSDHEGLSIEQIRAGEAVQALPRPQPPRDLAARTMARIGACKPVKRVFLLLRPITHPLARLAAAILIIYSLAPMTDLDIATPLGRGIEKNVLGSAATDRIEGFVDNMLVQHGPASYSWDPDDFMGVRRTNRTFSRAAKKS